MVYSRVDARQRRILARRGKRQEYRAAIIVGVNARDENKIDISDAKFMARIGAVHSHSSPRPFAPWSRNRNPSEILYVSGS